MPPVAVMRKKDGFLFVYVPFFYRPKWMRVRLIPGDKRVDRIYFNGETGRELRGQMRAKA